MMESSYSFPQDDYALTLLTQAAMHTHHSNSNTNTNTTDSPNSSYQRPASTSADPRASSTTPITNHHDQNQHNHRVSNVIQSRIPDMLGDYNPAVLSTRSMDTLTFNPAQTGRQNSYMNPAFHGIGSQISANYANNLGILNAESYDDGRGVLRAHEASEMRMKQQERTMPFGITDAPRLRMDLDPRADGEEADGASRRRKKPRIETHSADDEEEARKKARGRPRVDTKDETAADRRRTQIRMAQRAYRHRKETTISSLEKQVQDLRGSNEEMSNIFISLYDFAVGKGLLQREPEFGQHLQSTTERFLALAKASANDDSNHEENHTEESEKQNSVEPNSGRRQNVRKASPKKQQEATPPVSEPSNAWGGYTLSKEDSPIEEIPLDYQQNAYGGRGRSGDLQIITRPTEDNASFPFDFMDLQQYRVEVPSIEDFSQNFLPKSQPSLPNSFTYNEFSFARRIHRNTTERALKFLTTENPSEERMQRVFGICLMYETKEQIIERLKRVLATSNKETLHQWRAPFVHIGGAGTFYPMQDTDINGPLMPKFRTGYSMGPFSSEVSEAQGAMEDDMRCSLPGFGGDFFDVNDVEGYLRGRGIDIPPAADFVTAELDLASLADVSSPRSISGTATTFSPKTPRSPVDNILLNSNSELDSYGLDFSKADAETFSLGYSNWDITAAEKDIDSIDPIFSTLIEQETERKTPEVTTGDRLYPEKRVVTLNVGTLLEELISRCVCLGRSPGFRPSDVNIAIIAAVKAGFSS